MGPGVSEGGTAAYGRAARPGSGRRLADCPPPTPPPALPRPHGLRGRRPRLPRRPRPVRRHRRRRPGGLGQRRLRLPGRRRAPTRPIPSLWRQGQLVARQGLYEVCDGIYQVRGLDLSNMTLVEGDAGVIVIDPLISAETAAAALALYRTHRGDRPVTAIIYTHAHVDHFGGVRGVHEGPTVPDPGPRRLHGVRRVRERLRRRGHGPPVGLHVRGRPRQGPGRPDRLRARA